MGYQNEKKKLYKCFVDMKKTVNKVPRKMIRSTRGKKLFIINNGSSSYELV